MEGERCMAEAWCGHLQKGCMDKNLSLQRQIATELVTQSSPQACFHTSFVNATLIPKANVLC